MSKATRRNSLVGYLLVAPFLFFFVGFIIFPLADEVYISFLNNNTYQFAGLSNYAQLLTYPSYQEAIINTILYVGVGVNIKMFISLLLANALLLVDFPGKRWYRGIIILPWVIPLVPAALDWRWMMDPQFGLINQILFQMGLPGFGFLTTAQGALGSVIFIHIWTNTPFWSLILLSGLQSIPTSMYEAAKIDGASSVRTFRFITMPLIKRLYVISLTLSTIWTMGDFVTIWTLTRGGPADATQIIATEAYREAFDFGHFPLAASMFVVVLPILALFIFLLLRLLRERPSK